MSDLQFHPQSVSRWFSLVARLLLICAFGLLVSCTSPQLHQGFEPTVFASTPGSKVKLLLRMPAGTDLNGSAALILIEGKRGDKNSVANSFELKQTGKPVTNKEGSPVLSFALKSGDYARYDRTTKRIVKQLSAGGDANLRAQYRLCRRAGVTVSPPYVIGFLMVSDLGLPIFIAELELPAEIAKAQLPFCV